MHLKRLTLAAALTLSMAACATTQPGGGPGPIAPAEQTVADEQALFAAEAAYNLAATAYLEFADKPAVLPADRKAQAKATLMKSYDALKAARAARQLGNSASAIQQANAAVNLAAQVRAMLPTPGS